MTSKTLLKCLVNALSPTLDCVGFKASEGAAIIKVPLQETSVPNRISCRITCEHQKLQSVSFLFYWSTINNKKKDYYYFST
jgi:hypothetical protein